MAETQNVTLSLPRELLKRAKRLAADRDTSVSALMAEALARLADEDRRYSAARRRALAALSLRVLSARAESVAGRATSCMSGEPLEFVDANILVYALDASAGARRTAAERLMARLWDAGTGCLSVQVLHELFVTLTRKVAKPLSVEDATERVREYTAWRVFAPTADDVLAAIAVQRDARIGFWDAMIVHAAAEAGCSIVWTEDLNDGQIIRGVRVRNPFATPS